MADYTVRFKTMRHVSKNLYENLAFFLETRYKTVFL